MIMQDKWRGFSLPPGVVLAIFGAGVLFTFIVHDAMLHPELPVSSIVLNRTSDHDLVAGTSSAEDRSVLAPIRLTIDTTQTSANDPELLQELRNDIALAAGPVGSLADIAPSPSDDASPVSDWNMWGRLGSARAGVTLLDTPPAEGLLTYAVHSRDGATLCVVNRTQLKIPVRLTFHAPHSIYKLERLTFTPRSVTPDSRKPAVYSSLPAEFAEHTNARLEQLQGRDLTAANSIAFPNTLAAGQICLLRLTDTAYASRIALNQVRDQLKTLKEASPELSSRLNVILDGTSTFETALTGSSHLTPESPGALTAP